MYNMYNINAKIKELEMEIERQKKIKEELELMTEAQKLAIILHEKCCCWNHIDGCSWFYEIKNDIHDWNGSNHKTYLDKAQKALKITTFEIIVNLLNSNIFN